MIRIFGALPRGAFTELTNHTTDEVPNIVPGTIFASCTCFLDIFVFVTDHEKASIQPATPTLVQAKAKARPERGLAARFGQPKKKNVWTTTNMCGFGTPRGSRLR